MALASGSLYGHKSAHKHTQAQIDYLPDQHNDREAPRLLPFASLVVSGARPPDPTTGSETCDPVVTSDKGSRIRTIDPCGVPPQLICFLRNRSPFWASTGRQNPI